MITCGRPGNEQAAAVTSASATAQTSHNACVTMRSGASFSNNPERWVHCPVCLRASISTICRKKGIATNNHALWRTTCDRKYKSLTDAV